MLTRTNDLQSYTNIFLRSRIVHAVVFVCTRGIEDSFFNESCHVVNESLMPLVHKNIITFYLEYLCATTIIHFLRSVVLGSLS